MAFTKKKKYYSKKLEEGNGRNMYKVVNKLLDKKQDTVLPEAKSDEELADSLLCRVACNQEHCHFTIKCYQAAPI